MQSRLHLLRRAINERMCSIAAFIQNDQLESIVATTWFAATITPQTFTTENSSVAWSPSMGECGNASPVPTYVRDTNFEQCQSNHDNVALVQPGVEFRRLFLFRNGVSFSDGGCATCLRHCSIYTTHRAGTRELRVKYPDQHGTNTYANTISRSFGSSGSFPPANGTFSPPRISTRMWLPILRDL